MNTTIVSKVQVFRKSLMESFTFRADATMDLIDSIAANGNDSVVKTSLSALFRREYSSITDVIDNFFRCQSRQNPTKEELQKKHIKLSQLLVTHCPLREKRRFILLATDCTAKPRIYAKTVADCSIVHAPNHIPGQKPITVGHEYSLVVYLPENEQDRKAHWVIPLKLDRVRSGEIGSVVGIEQLSMLITETNFHSELCVSVADAAYSTKHSLVKGAIISNWVQISRLRNNRILFRQPKPSIKKRGRPSSYGEALYLNNPEDADEKIRFQKITTAGKHVTIEVCRWKDVLIKGNKSYHTETLPFDAVRVQIFDENGRIIFKKPLWLMVAGIRRDELTLQEICECYFQRYDIEHYFRFSKQKLPLARSQTPDTRHEENLAVITMLSYNMLYSVRHLARDVKYPWEKPIKSTVIRTFTPTQVHRDYERIIQEIGTPACVPKLRGKSPGRCLGAKIPLRPLCPIVKKRPFVVRC